MKEYSKNKIIITIIIIKDEKKKISEVINKIIPHSFYVFGV